MVIDITMRGARPLRRWLKRPPVFAPRAGCSLCQGQVSVYVQMCVYVYLYYVVLIDVIDLLMSRRGRAVPACHAVGEPWGGSHVAPTLHGHTGGPYAGGLGQWLMTMGGRNLLSLMPTCRLMSSQRRVLGATFVHPVRPFAPSASAKTGAMRK